MDTNLQASAVVTGEDIPCDLVESSVYVNTSRWKMAEWVVKRQCKK